MMSVRRTSWRTVDSYADKEQKSPDPENPGGLENIKAYQNTIAEEIDGVIEKAPQASPLPTSHGSPDPPGAPQVITDVVKVYTEGPLKAEVPENLVFFHKMCARPPRSAAFRRPRLPLLTARGWLQGGGLLPLRCGDFGGRQEGDLQEQGFGGAYPVGGEKTLCLPVL